MFNIFWNPNQTKCWYVSSMNLSFPGILKGFEDFSVTMSSSALKVLMMNVDQGIETRSGKGWWINNAHGRIIFLLWVCCDDSHGVFACSPTGFSQSSETLRASLRALSPASLLYLFPSWRSAAPFTNLGLIAGRRRWEGHGRLARTALSSFRCRLSRHASPW